MKMQSAIQSVIDRRDLTAEEMRGVMRTIMSGGATPAQIGGFLVGLRCKGETVEEIAAAAEVMRELAVKVDVRGPNLVDTCGTGGDARGTFNISTTAAFVVAAAGGRVAKHGNRSVSSRCGSADVLEAAGVNLELGPEQVAQCVGKLGVGFLFAPRHHSAMQHAIAPRKEMGVRTLFNLLGPLSNPAGAPHQLIGVYAEDWIEPLARVLQRLGSRHVLVVHAEDGLDEISVGAPTRVAELRSGRVETYAVKPEQFGLERAPLSRLSVTSVEESLAVVKSVLDGKPGPARDIVALNAGAAIYAADLADTLAEGVKKAESAIDSGAARRKLDDLVALSQSF